MINGHGPFKMLIDTGATSCILTPQAAQEAGLVFDHRTVLATLAGEKMVTGASTNEIAVGDDREAGVDIVVIDLPQVRILDSKADGVLGQRFLGRSPYLIDYKLKRLWRGPEAVERARRLPITVAGRRLHDRTVLPVVLEPGAPPWSLTLDSGASNLVVKCNERCPPLRGTQQSGMLLTYVGDQQVSHGKLRHLEVGGMTLAPAEAVLVDSPWSDDQDDGVLPTHRFAAIFIDGPLVKFSLP